MEAVKLYQNLEIEGEEFLLHNSNRKNSKFWNKGKWDNFISPLIIKPTIDQTFVEMGTNAGLFLKFAKDMGFHTVIGIEKDKTPVKEGLRYRDILGYNYKILKQTLGSQFGENGTFNIDELPVADITLMSTFHYYIDINSWIKYLDKLKNKTRYCIIVSRHVRKVHWRALSDYSDVQNYFSEWQEVKKVNPISDKEKENDPSPRNLWSVLYKSSLERIQIENIITESKNDSMYLAMQQLAKEVTCKDSIKIEDTNYYKAWVKRKKERWKVKTIDNFVKNKVDMLFDIKCNGVKDPLIINKNNKLYDGGHRLSILKGLGHKSVIVRRV